MTASAPMPLHDLFTFQASVRLDDGGHEPETVRDIVIDWFIRKAQKATHDRNFNFPMTWANQRAEHKEAAIESLIGVAPSGATFWAAQLEHKTPNKKCIKRYEAALAIPQNARAAELSLRISAESLTDFELSAAPLPPFVVMDLVRHLELYADGQKLNTQHNIARDDLEAVADIGRLICNPRRNKPVILVSYATKAERENFHLFEDLFRRTRGSAHVFICPTATLRRLEDRIGTPKLPAGHLSLFPPGPLSQNEMAGVKHYSYQIEGQHAFPHQLAKDVAKATLSAPQIDDIAPRFATIKGIITPHETIETLSVRLSPAERFTGLASPTPSDKTEAPEPRTRPAHKTCGPRV